MGARQFEKRPPLDEMQEAKKQDCGISSHRRSRPASCIFLVTCHKKEAKMRDAGMQSRGINRPSVHQAWMVLGDP